MTPVHIPVLRRGKPYESLDQANILDHRTGGVLATVEVNTGGVLSTTEVNTGGVLASRDVNTGGISVGS